jgi:phage baseplate assembly protein W
MDYKYSDADSRLRKTSTGNVLVKYDEDVIEQSIKTIFATISGERVRSPFGSNLIRFLFDPMNKTTTKRIRRTILGSIEQYEPRVELLNVEVIPFYDNHYYEVIIQYRIIGLKGLFETSTKLRQLTT